MLAALLTWMLLGGSDGMDLFPKAVQKRVPAVVADEARADSVVAQMRQIQAIGTDVDKKARSSFKAWRKRDQAHDAGPELLTDVLDEVDAGRKVALEELVDGIYAMRSEMEREEWHALFRPHEAEQAE
jgi:hypothetical protein